MIIGERLKGILKHRNISAKDFAKMIGVTEGMIYKYYKMEIVNSDVLEKWGSVLYISIMAFMDDAVYEEVIHEATDVDKVRAAEYYDENKEQIHAQNQKIFGVPQYELLSEPNVSYQSNDEKQNEYKRYQESQVTISREVFDQISRLTETVLSQQKTIEALREECKKMRVQMGETATCALASGSDISTIDIKSSNIK